MAKRGGQGRQGHLRSQWHHLKALDDIGDDPTNLLGIEIEVFPSAEQSLGELVQDLRRKNEVILQGDLLDQTKSLCALIRIGTIEGVDEDVGVDQDPAHALGSRS